MSIGNGDLLTIRDKKYIILSLLNYENKNYAFVNKIVNNDITPDFYILEIYEDNSVKMVYEDEIKNILIPKFEIKLQEEIKKMNIEK